VGYGVCFLDFCVIGLGVVGLVFLLFGLGFDVGGSLVFLLRVWFPFVCNWVLSSWEEETHKDKKMVV